MLMLEMLQCCMHGDVQAVLPAVLPADTANHGARFLCYPGIYVPLQSLWKDDEEEMMPTHNGEPLMGDVHHAHEGTACLLFVWPFPDKTPCCRMALQGSPGGLCPS